MMMTKTITLLIVFLTLFGFTKSGITFFEDIQTAPLPSIKASAVVYIPGRRVEESGNLETIFDISNSDDCIKSCLQTKLCHSVSFNLLAMMCILSSHDASSRTNLEEKFVQDAGFQTFAL